MTSKAVSCRGPNCDAQFFWVECVRRNGTTGRVPLDMEQVEVENKLDPEQLRGKFVFISDDRVRAAVCGDYGPFFESHYTSCVNADMFRGNK